MVSSACDLQQITRHAVTRTAKTETTKLRLSRGGYEVGSYCPTFGDQRLLRDEPSSGPATACQCHYLFPSFHQSSFPNPPVRGAPLDNRALILMAIPRPPVAHLHTWPHRNLAAPSLAAAPHRRFNEYSSHLRPHPKSNSSAYVYIHIYMYTTDSIGHYSGCMPTYILHNTRSFPGRLALAC